MPVDLEIDYSMGDEDIEAGQAAIVRLQHVSDHARPLLSRSVWLDGTSLSRDQFTQWVDEADALAEPESEDDEQDAPQTASIWWRRRHWLAVQAALPVGVEAIDKPPRHNYFWKPGLKPGFFCTLSEGAESPRIWVCFLASRPRTCPRKKQKKRVHRSPITLTDARVLLKSSARLFVCTSAIQVASRSRVKGNQPLFDNCMIRDDLPVDFSFPTRNLVREA